MVRRVQEGKINLEDDPRPGRTLTAVTKENVAAVERLTDQDPQITYQSIEEILGIGSAAVTLVATHWCENGSRFARKITIFEPSFLVSTEKCPSFGMSFPSLRLT